MGNDPDLRQRVIEQTQGATLLHLAFIGVTNGLLSELHRLGEATAPDLSRATRRDPGYVERWCDAAFAYELLEERAPGVFALSALGTRFRPEAEDTLMPFAVNCILGAHMAERAAGLMPDGEQPGERVLAERATILPWFGPMLEAMFGPFFERQILPAVPAFSDVDARGGLVVDLGCGNGWYLRRLAARFPGVRGIGLDAVPESIEGARARAAEEGVGDRVQFRVGDIHGFQHDEPVDLIAMSRALHHVWTEREELLGLLARLLRPGGWLVIWEPAWPAERASLRGPTVRPMAFQNLAEHVQGNRFLRPDEIAEALGTVGLTPNVHLFAEGKEAVVTGHKPD